MTAPMQLSRRGFLRTLAAGTAGLPLLVEACTTPAPPAATPTSASTRSTSSATASSPYPNFYAFTPPAGVKADYHDADPRYEDGFENYPSSPFKSSNKQPPGSGSTVDVYMYAYNPVPNPRDQNSTWREVERQLNATVNMSIAPGTDYTDKL